MPILAKFEDKSYELTALEAREYREIDGREPEELSMVAANVVEMLGDDEESHEQFVNMAKKLSAYWYNSKGHKFQQEPSESFLIYLVEAYVAKHDADNIMDALTDEPPSPVVLSERSAALYKALRTQAMGATQDPLQQDQITTTFDSIQGLIAQSIVKKQVLNALLRRMVMEQLFRQMSSDHPEGEAPSIDAEGNPSDPSAALFFMMMMGMMGGGQPDPENDETVLHQNHGIDRDSLRVRIEEVSEPVSIEPKAKPTTFAEAKRELSTLAQDKYLNTPVFEKVKNLILLATRQQFDGCPEEQLFPIMEKTRMLLNKEMDVDAYKDYAKNLQGSSSTALKVLGIAMMAVATVFLCHFVAAAVVGAGILTTLGLGVAGGGFMGTGYSMFAHKPRGMCQAALETAETYNSSLTVK